MKKINILCNRNEKFSDNYVNRTVMKMFALSCKVNFNRLWFSGQWKRKRSLDSYLCQNRIQQERLLDLLAEVRLIRRFRINGDATHFRIHQKITPLLIIIMDLHDIVDLEEKKKEKYISSNEIRFSVILSLFLLWGKSFYFVPRDFRVVVFMIR